MKGRGIEYYLELFGKVCYIQISAFVDQDVKGGGGGCRDLKAYLYFLYVINQ